MQELPVKLYRTPDRVTVATPMPGLLPSDITVEITPDCQLLLRGELRGVTEPAQVFNRFVLHEGERGVVHEVVTEEWELLLDEWQAGDCRRELELPAEVDGERATATYGNGVLVVALPVAERTTPARFGLESISAGRGERIGSAGHPVHPLSTAEHRAAKAAEQSEHGGRADPHGS